MEMTTRSYRNLQKTGGAAAFYLATSMLAAMAYFLLIARIPDGATPAEKLAALAVLRSGQYIMTLAVYVVFGLALVVLAAALHARLRDGADACMKGRNPGRLHLVRAPHRKRDGLQTSAWKTALASCAQTPRRRLLFGHR
jgi:hypothetical protein